MPLLVLFVWMQAALPEQTRLTVIVNAAAPTTDISTTDLRSIYLGQITRWPNHRAILPVVIRLDTAAGNLFLRHLIGMGQVDYAQNWIGMVFRGQAASPPLVAASTSEAARFVAAHSESIAIVAGVPAANRNVRILNVDGKPPDADDYPLRW